MRVAIRFLLAFLLRATRCSVIGRLREWVIDRRTNEPISCSNFFLPETLQAAPGGSSIRDFNKATWALSRLWWSSYPDRKSHWANCTALLLRMSWRSRMMYRPVDRSSPLPLLPGTVEREEEDAGERNGDL